MLFISTTGLILETRTEIMICRCGRPCPSINAILFVLFRLTSKNDHSAVTHLFQGHVQRKVIDHGRKLFHHYLNI